MRVIDFSFKLPESLIAHYPVPGHSSYRLLSLGGPTGALAHGIFTDLLDRLSPDNLLVFSDTRATPVRLFGHKANGGKTKALVERMLSGKRILTHIRVSKAPKPSVELLLGDDESINAIMTARHGMLFEVEFNDQRSVPDILNSIGYMLLPPCIDRSDEDAGRELYQTVYSEKPNVMAAPAAGLHLDEPSLEKSRAKGVEMAFVTLYVGMGTLQSARVNTIEGHIIHSGYAEVPQDVVDAVLTVRACGSRVIAVGTTSVRSLENAVQATKNDLIEPFFGGTQIFIYPDFQYEVVDALATNFHLLEPTLIMLVSAPAGYQRIMDAHKVAVGGKYRFFSYGDTVFTTHNPQVTNECTGE